MRGKGAPQWLEEKRRLAVERLSDGYTPEEVADFLDAGLSSVYRWQACHRESGWRGLAAHPVSGRPPKLTEAQAREVLDWVRHGAQEFGFPTARWTAPRLAQAISRHWGTELHPRYLNAWLRQRGITPQVPSLMARERDPAAIAHWEARPWEAIKKRPALGARP